jgi:hypothetical protein
MSGYPDVGAFLTRLLDRKGPGVAELPGAGDEERELREVLGGEAPGPPFCGGWRRRSGCTCLICM